jgi:hypothetical protein
VQRKEIDENTLGALKGGSGNGDAIRRFRKQCFACVFFLGRYA